MKRFEHTICGSTAIRTGVARKIAKIARQFSDTAITISCGEKTICASASLRLMTMGLHRGNRITVTCDGPDEMAATVAMQNYFWNHL